MELHNLGHLELHRGNVAVAERCFAELSELLDPGDPYEAAMGQLSQAALAVVRGDRERAAGLLGRVQATLGEVGRWLSVL